MGDVGWAALSLLPRGLVLLGLLTRSTVGLAQVPAFPLEQFHRNDALARWLLRYDGCAWKSSDELQKAPRDSLMQLGPAWLCLEDGDAWHAFYGRYDPASDRYDILFHYLVLADRVAASSIPIDTARVLAGVRAVTAGMDHVPEAFKRGGPRFNAYAHFGPDSSVTAWFLPAWQPDGTAVFGAELAFRFDAAGLVLADSHVIPGPLRATRPDTSVFFRLDSGSHDAPTVGDLFFFYLMRPYFRDLRIQTRRFSSRIIRADGKEAWVHVERPAPDR